MDFSRVKKVLAGVSTAAILASQLTVGVRVAFAKYSDVPSGVWYEDSVEALLADGILDEGQPRFRGGDLANRAEFVKLLVMMNGGLLSTPPAVASFNDVAPAAWYYPYMEEAGKEGWVKGDGNCYGSKPCYARPAANINRAEAAALIVRAFALEGTGDAPQFVDNASGQWYTDVIQTAADYCVLQGDESTRRVRPSDNMNRAEMVVMLHRVDQGLTYGVDCTMEGPSREAGISDVSSTALNKVEVEFTVAVDQASAEDASNYTVTGATPAVTVTSAKLVGDDVVELMLSGNLTSGNEYTLTVDGVESDDGDMISDSMSFNGYSTLPTSNGTLQVAVSSKNPVGDTVPQGAVGVTMLSVDVTASCDDAVSIEDLTILHEGFGSEQDITGVYASVNGARLSRKRTIDSKDQTANIHFSSPLTVSACKTVTVDLVGDFLSTAQTSGEHNLAVELPSDFQSNAKSVTGNFPMRGATFRVAAVRSGQVTVEYRTVTPNEVNVGDDGVVLGRFQVQTDSVEDQTIYAMTIENDGSANDGDITNMKIRRSDGTVLTNTVAATTDGFATFIFDPPFTVLEGDKITLEIVGDVEGGAADTVILQFEESSDLFAVGSLYGYGVNGQLYGSRVSISSSTTVSTVTIDAGEFTVEIDGPAQQTYTRDQNDAVLANVIFTTGGDRIDVKRMYVAVQGNTSTGAILAGNNGSTSDQIHEVLENVTLRNKTTGRAVDGVRLTDTTAFGTGSSTVGTFQVYRFDDFTVTGKESFELRVDFIDNGSGASPKNGDQFKVHICGEPTKVSTGTNSTGCSFGSLLSSTTSAQAKSFQMEVEGISTGDNVLDVRPRGTISGNAQRIATATLTVAVKALASTDTAVKNSKNINLLRFEARAGEAKDILFTKATFTGSVAATSLQNAQNYTLWVDTDSDGKVDTILQKGVTSQSNKITFSELTGGGFVIPKEKTVVFEVHADIASSFVSGISSLKLGFSTGDSDYVQAEQVDRGSSLSGIRTNNTCSVSGGCDITVTTVGSTLYSLVSQGNLYVTKDNVPLRNRQLLGGALGEAVLRLNLRGEYEPIDVTDLQINSSGSTATSVDRLELYKEGETTPFASATVGGCGSDDVLGLNYGTSASTTQAFCAKMQSRQLVVPKGADVKVIVQPRMKLDVDGAVSNERLAFFINTQSVSNNASGSGAVRARGDQSSNNLTAGSGSTANGNVFIGCSTACGAPTGFYSTGTGLNPIGNTNFSVLSKITSITNANPDANGSNVPTGVSDIGQFKFTTAANGNSKNGLNKAVLSGVVFNVNATNIIMDPATFKFYNKSNSTVTASCTTMTTGGVEIGFSASGSFVVRCHNLQTATSVNTSIDPNTSQTFVLQANITNPDVTAANTSSLQVSLQQFENVGRTSFGPTATAAVSHLIWVDSDSSTPGSGTTTSGVFTWVEYPETTIKSTAYQS